MPAEDRGEVQMGKAGFQPLLQLDAIKELLKDQQPRKRCQLLVFETKYRNLVEFCQNLCFYWTSLAVASWMWSIILEDNRFKPYSTGFRKFFLLLSKEIFCNYRVYCFQVSPAVDPGGWPRQAAADSDLSG